MYDEVGISVIMGVHNPRSHIRFFEAVESILQQSRTDWELLICCLLYTSRCV